MISLAYLKEIKRKNHKNEAKIVEKIKEVIKNKE